MSKAITRAFRRETAWPEAKPAGGGVAGADGGGDPCACSRFRAMSIMFAEPADEAQSCSECREPRFPTTKIERSQASAGTSSRPARFDVADGEAEARSSFRDLWVSLLESPGRTVEQVGAALTVAYRRTVMPGCPSS